MKKSIFAIIGSASANSSNLKLVRHLANRYKDSISVDVFDGLAGLPHFNPELSTGNTPQGVIDFREAIAKADAVLICTPEYIFSIPAGLKNALEWCVATTIFDKKPVGIITASASGEKGHEELQLIMQTLGATLQPQTSILIQGAKGKIAPDGNITDALVDAQLTQLIEGLAI